ncbi:C4-dicarboxylate ABC transporter [Mesobacillus campisalis]|uniref:C4-dicarboxylate ABC transporter n=1 Tax=Mesobacillus campisalis TaxID=1408103 RepID=A0A0M2SR44_9BACI|nr:TRAP transporter substrate-binding protein [Mesobacillus campisalis]KKK36146.1 C4-dicarboxylate ABC transporter [Mesobacillus campisalis]
MKRKTLSMLSLSAVLAGSVFLAGCGNSESSSGESGGSEKAEPVVLKLAENQPDDYPTTIGDKEFAKLVEEKTDGRYKIEVYSGGQLGDEKSVIEQVQLGTIDLARVNGSPLAEFSKDLGVLSMPYLFKDETHQWDVLNGETGEELLATLESASLVGLTYYDSGDRSFYNTKRKVEKPEDLKGLKIRVQESALFIDMIEALGASPTPMAYGEVYSALQTGVIDGAENNFPSYYSSNHFEVAKHFTLDGHSRVPEVVIGSKKLWDSLSDEDKKAFKEAARESQDVQREAWKELVEKSKQEVEAAGSEIVEITDVAPWREAVQPLYDKYGKDYSQWIEKIENQ